MKTIVMCEIGDTNILKCMYTILTGIGRDKDREVRKVRGILLRGMQQDMFLEKRIRHTKAGTLSLLVITMRSPKDKYVGSNKCSTSTSIRLSVHALSNTDCNTCSLMSNGENSKTTSKAHSIILLLHMIYGFVTTFKAVA